MGKTQITHRKSFQRNDGSRSSAEYVKAISATCIWPWMQTLKSVGLSCFNNKKDPAIWKVSFLGSAGIGRMGLFSTRLVHFFLCSIYGVKNEHQKNMPQLRRYVASSLVRLWPKVIKYGLRFLKWTIRNVSKLCQNSINFILNFQFEKKSSLKNVRLVH